MLATTVTATPPNSTQPVTSATSSSNSPVPVATSCSSSLSPSAVIGCNLSNNNNVQGIKCEPHLTPSPTGSTIASENSNQQQLVDDAIKNSTASDSSSLQRESSVMQRKNSSSSLSSVINNNGSGALVHTSPTSSNHNNDSSNSSNSAISQIVDSDAIASNAQQQQQQQQQPALHECNTNNPVKGSTKTGIVDDSNENVNINPSTLGTFQNNCTSKESSSSSTSSSSSSSSSSASNKDDTEIHNVLGNLANVKKEQRSVDTPEMSPDGFNSLPSLTGNNQTTVTGVGISSGSNNNNEGKSANILGAGCGITSAGGSSNCITNLLHDSSPNGQQANVSGSVSIMSNSMEYMQQQNHIFVFSTQLANKGAESVLSGQFPTIIAYHCTQPATKKFLEDFFLKNPLKMAKIQRQNSLNMVISASHQWMGSGNCVSTKNQQKINGRNAIGNVGASNNQICNDACIEDKMSASALAGSSNTNFSDAADTLSAESDLMNWEQSNIGLENITNNSNTSHAIKIGETTDNIIGSPHSVASSITQQSPNKSSIGNSAAPVSPGDNLQPSLQGVKVPDENLTPQQRQHREEQLAKLKKMNQFLFPEHGGDLLPDSSSLQGPNQLAKNNSDIIIAGSSGSGVLVGILGDSSNNNTSGIGVGNQQQNLRGSSNIIGMGRGSGTMGRNSVNLGPGTPDETGIPVGIIGGAGDLNNIHCGNQNTVPNNLLMNTQQGLSCGSGNIMASIGSDSHVGGINVNHGLSQGSIMSHNTMASGGINSMNNCGAPSVSSSLMLQSGQSKGINSAHQLGMSGGGGPTQIEWSKMQHQFYEERSRSNKGNPDIMSGITGLCRSIPSAGGNYVRPSPTGSAINGSPSGTIGPTSRSQGPPPPYHPTQRSASVPIATQSPNPSSPNNPTSNLSLPSPRTASGSCGTTLNSPSSDVLVSASSATTSTTLAITPTALSAATSTSSNPCKAFQQEDSPTAPTSNVNSGSNIRNNLNQFSSSPNTPLSNMSPKDLDSLNSTGIAGDVKNSRPSPQRSRTPHVGGNSNSESNNLEGRFPPASPGINFSPHIQTQGNGTKHPSSSVDNISSGQASFGRRPDNLPLNPNSSRPPPIKQTHHFDPISSLAQMSQQLTSCVSSNGGIGGPSSVGITNPMSSEMPIGGSSHQSIDGLMGPGGPIDTGMDHCGNIPGSPGGMTLPPHMMGSGGQYGTGGCHMGGSIINPMGSRLLAPKMAFGAGPNVMRDGPSGFHGAMPPHRMMGRMGVNFCPFNGSPNIQVKASTPNTIQYMPARPQTSNGNQRVPPSLEFLQRFANPQLSGPNMSDGSMIASGPAGNSDLSKMPNASTNSNMQNSGMTYFQNCNQLGSGSSPGNINGGNQSDMVPGMMSGLSEMGGIMNINNSQSGMNIRGVRPVRQGSMGPGGSPVGGIHRMQAPGSHLLGGPCGMNQFSNNPHELMECVNSDSNGLFGNTPGGPNQIFGNQQKGSSMGSQSHCQNMSPANIMNGSVGSNEQNSSMQGQINVSGMIGANGNGSAVTGSGPVPGSITGSSSNGPGNYKSYMTQSTNDIKYAQQYHNFQQQLYATSTRSHVSQQMNGSPAMGMPGSGINSGIPTNSNAGFFVSK